ncbi:MAG: tRNA threonylcarbamoyladenosine dehydratase, partial [Selenomonadaceae bacterium]|nr:tRNA threonylcarbamoyladenosine dehydratase [Selenomonadaceae bacterium]
VAKIMRKKLKELGIKNLKVVYSDEIPRAVDTENLTGKIIGSLAFVPSVAGLIIAAEVVKDLINEK